MISKENNKSCGRDGMKAEIADFFSHIYKNEKYPCSSMRNRFLLFSSWFDHIGASGRLTFMRYPSTSWLIKTRHFFSVKWTSKSRRRSQKLFTPPFSSKAIIVIDAIVAIFPVVEQCFFFLILQVHCCCIRIFNNVDDFGCFYEWD